MITASTSANIVIMIKCALMFTFRSQNASVVSVIAISNRLPPYVLMRFIHTANPARYTICPNEIRI